MAIPSPEEQEAELESRRVAEANERVERRERLGHDEQNEEKATTTPEEARASLSRAEERRQAYNQDEINKQAGT